MSHKTGRNDPCPCGSGKKFKVCCMKMPTGKKKFTATVLSQPKSVDLMERTFGHVIPKTSEVKLPPLPSSVGESNPELPS